jgi:hypothetical protein
MAIITTRTQLGDYCLRKLGSPVLEVNVADDQVSDRIDDAIQYWQEFHTDASARILLKHLVTTTDITNRFITIPDYILSVQRVLPTSIFSTGMFDIRYQTMMNDVLPLGFTGNLSHFIETKTYIRMVELLLNGGEPTIEYSRHMDKLEIFWEWGKDILAGQYIMFDATRLIDPTSNSQVYNDYFLKKYATTLIKQQWGTNLKKFEGMMLPGGVTLNGQTIYNEAVEELTKLEEEMQTTWVEPVDFYLG